MSKENAAACNKTQKRLMETDKQNTEDEEKKQATTQSTSSEEEPKPKEEEKPTEEEHGKNVQEKREDEKMEVEPCPETVSSCEEKGKY